MKVIRLLAKKLDGFKNIKTNSIKFKVSILYTVVLGIILILFSTVLYAVLWYYLSRDTDTRLKLKSLEAVTTINSYVEIIGDKPGALAFAVEKTFFYDKSDFPINLFDMGKIKRLENRWQERSDALKLNNNYMAFVFSDVQVLLKNKEFPSQLVPVFLELARKSTAHPKTVFYNARFKKNLLRVIAMPYIENGKKHVLLIGISQEPVERLLRSLLQAMMFGIPLVLVLTSFVGLVFVEGVLEPIEEIARTARRITHEDLSARVKPEHVDEEIEYVVASFNDMIGRLEKSFEHINEFSSQVAHELKTPLAIIKGESELALSQEREKEDYKAALRINVEEADRMRRTIEDLLLLARLDYQTDVFQLQPLDFTEFFHEICEQATILAADKGLTVEAEIPSEKIIVRGDKLHLRRVFFNIIDNAIKFTPASGKIRLRAVRKGKLAFILIADTGVGIPARDLPKIFEKFYHVDRTGGNTAKGTGLGLSIVQSILKIHRGHVHVTSKVNQGTSFHIMLPVNVKRN